MGVTVAACGAALASASCGGSDDDPAVARPAANPATDKLAQIAARGTLVLSTDPLYPPQSFAVKGSKRAASTKCAENQLTASQISGYDADTGKLVARRLGVEPCFVVPTWTQITAGNWADRWDIAYGSGAINTDRMKHLWMTQPYRVEPQRFFVRKGSPYRVPSDLDGKRIGVCSGCTVEFYLKGVLAIPGTELAKKVDAPRIVEFEVEPPGLKALSVGKLDGFLTAEAVGEEAIKQGRPLRALDDVAFTMPLTGFVDKSSGLAVKPFIDRVDAIVSGLLSDGTMSKLSVKYFGKDYAAAAKGFDMGSIGQQVSQ
ncbi:MAG TPA: transporter substrate-binding domain-containing protein [Baekduia sp.]|uniref:transporter substrate-binding domain-containing protein n=1 Tax=Baekduia sp. TaxID=2600305 RepID=UPI002D767C94|nr:transporter substrate-binding domain-containing protein [Baekduia sp.]HET6507505.1 transporter substrate-binding domain-containing protein [Baekduia sp.]